MRQAALLGLVLALVFGRDALTALGGVGGGATNAPLDVDRGLSQDFKVKQLLEQQFPGIEVLGTTYPLSAGRQVLARAVGAAQLAGFGVVFLGGRLFEAAGVAPAPEWYQRVRSARPTWALGTWLVGNMAQSSLSSSGAFEIYFNGQLMFSKLASGRLPTSREWEGLTRDVRAALDGSPAARERLAHAELDRDAARARAALAA